MYEIASVRIGTGNALPFLKKPMPNTRSSDSIILGDILIAFLCTVSLSMAITFASWSNSSLIIGSHVTIAVSSL